MSGTNGNGGKQVALWAGLSTFFGAIVGLKLLEHIAHQDWAQLAGAMLISGLVAGGAYSKERLAAARRRSFD